MTTTVTVGTTGRMQPSVSAAWAALPSTLADDYIFELYNDSEFTDLWDLSGKTMAGHTVLIKPATGQGIGDHASKDTNPVRYDQSKGVGVSAGVDGLGCWTIACAGITIDGIQFKIVGPFPAAAGIVVSGAATGVKIKNCLVQTAYNVSSLFYSDAIDTKFWNCVALYNMGSALGAVSAFVVWAYYQQECVACTAANCSTGGGGAQGFKTGGVAPKLESCMSFGFGAATDVATGLTGDNNCTDASTGWGTGSNNLYSKTFLAQFENITAATPDLRIKAGGDAVGKGLRNATATGDLDIVKRSRSIGIAPAGPSIGAWEYGATAPSALDDYYPTGDAAVGTWTTSSGTGTLASHVDDPIGTTTPDADYIQSVFGTSPDLEVKLLAGNGSLVETWIHAPAPTVFTDIQQVLLPAKADLWAAGGYTNSILRFTYQGNSCDLLYASIPNGIPNTENTVNYRIKVA